MPHPNEDPIVTSSRREAVLTVVLWATALTYSVGYCYLYGYNRELDSSLDGMEFFFGWPDWVFWGIVVPWGTCTVVSTIFAFFVMTDAPLGEDRDDDEELI
ncbi:MAG: DUF997 family protein [Planctomycetaceae bacterium]|nr:DUF997 family protein [Planctomycetaceae bacterium]